MIVISRMKDEGIVIGDNIVVRILEVTGDSVELCIETIGDAELPAELLRACRPAADAALALQG